MVSAIVFWISLHWHNERCTQMHLLPINFKTARCIVLLFVFNKNCLPKANSVFISMEGELKTSVICMLQSSWTCDTYGLSSRFLSKSSKLRSLEYLQIISWFSCPKNQKKIQNTEIIVRATYWTESLPKEIIQTGIFWHN